MSNSKNIGNNLERETGKWLQGHDEKCPKFGEIASSNWRVGHLLNFDVVSKKYAVECKKRKKLPKWLTDAWAQIKQEADKHHKKPLLVLRENRGEPLHIISAERHAQLLDRDNSKD